MFRCAVTAAPFGLNTSAGEDQRHTRRMFKQRLLLPLAVLPKLKSMVRPEDDRRLFREAQAVHRGEDLSDLSIHKRGSGIIPLDCLLPLVGSHAEVWWMGPVSRWRCDLKLFRREGNLWNRIERE